MFEVRKYIIGAFFIIIGLVYAIRLYFLQVADSSYKQLATANVIQKITKYPYRGIMYDRNGDFVVYNQTVFDLAVVPSEVPEDFDTLGFCNLMHITKAEFRSKMKVAIKQFNRITPPVFIKQINTTEFAKIQDKLTEYEGFYPQPRLMRSYPHTNMAHSLGYIREIDANQLKNQKGKYYRMGDYIGQRGLEKSYEEQLRGVRGTEYILKNARNIPKGSFENGRYDTAAIKGSDLYLSIDLELQAYAERLMKGKWGGLVAIEPSTGELLAVVSNPNFDPNRFTGRQFGRNYGILSTDSSKPLLNRAFGTMAAPGSTWKIFQALISLQEGIITPETQIYCPLGIIGDHITPGNYNIFDAIRISSNTFFVKLFRRQINRKLDPNTFTDTRLGYAKWREWVDKFGFGRKLGTDLPTDEKKGNVPTTAYFDKLYGHDRWKYSMIRSMAIGQGEIQATTLQIANLAAIVANNGYYIIPHHIRGVGEELTKPEKFTEKHYVGVDEKYFPLVKLAMQAAIERGTASMARIPNLEICGKTGTAENPHGKDHSVFMCFAPRENPKIAVATFVENAGYGGSVAAPISSLVIEKYLNDTISTKGNRQWIEKRMLDMEIDYARNLNPALAGGH